jgi:hypothetical protein
MFFKNLSEFGGDNEPSFAVNAMFMLPVKHLSSPPLSPTFWVILGKVYLHGSPLSKEFSAENERDLPL